MTTYRIISGDSHFVEPPKRSRQFIETEIKGIPEATMQKIVGDNASRLYGLG
jgi:predicted TIM-barrel fold metal-dependent hydrolase